MTLALVYGGVMLLSPEPDQAFFRETTARFLGELAPVTELRRLRDDPVGYDADYWRRGAELGWTSLLVDEAHGGGSISGAGLVDLSLVAFEFGFRASPGPLLPTNLVAAALGADATRALSATQAELLGGLLAGTAVAGWAHGEPPPGDHLGDVALTITVDGDELVLDGTKRPVEAAAGASHLLVTGRTGDGLTQVLVPTDAAGVTVTPMRGVDLTRRFAAVRFDGVRVPASEAVGEVGGAADAIDHLVHLAIAIGCAESVGAMQAGFDMTLEWAGDRYSFGRKLASYQAIKHRFADMTAWLEASHAISDTATAAIAAGADDAADLASAAKAYIGDTGSELLHEGVQMHGGIGVTYEHDLHLFLRRHTVNRALYGTPPEHRQRLTDRFQIDEEGAA